LYNLALLVVVVAVFLYNLPQSRQELSFDLFEELFIFAVLANVAYCAAYPVDIVAQSSGYQGTWLRIRWLLLALGTSFASVIAQFVARGLFSAAT